MAGNYEETIALDVSIDLGAPTTQVESVFGESGDNGWYRSQVDVVLNATDEWSGLDKTMCRWTMVNGSKAHPQR